MAVGAAGNNSSSVSCAAGKIAVGGGFTASNTSAVITSSVPLFGSNPALANQIPNGWRVTNSGSGSVTAYVVCAN